MKISLLSIHDRLTMPDQSQEDREETPVGSKCSRLDNEPEPGAEHANVSFPHDNGGTKRLNAKAMSFKLSAGRREKVERCRVIVWNDSRGH